MHITEEQFRRIEGCFPTQRVTVEISSEEVIRIRVEALSLDRTIVQVHAERDERGRKKRPAVHRTIPRRLEHQES